MSDGISEKMSSVSTDPGVYLMKNAKGDVIYVGKAGNLKKRLGSYFKNSGFKNSSSKKSGFKNSVPLDMKTGVLVKKISTFETIVTGTEKEALILESNLIKRYRPRYNVILKDDKRYPSFRIDVKSRFPNITVVRKIKKDGALYFGPYASSQAVRRTLKIIHKTFKLRKCKIKDFKNRSRPCLNFQMGACLAPCCRKVDQILYDEIVREVVLFLKGRTPDLIKKIKKDMILASKEQNFEKAALLRDKMFSLEQTLEKQVAVTTDFKDRDIFAIARSPVYSPVYSIGTVLFVRGGYLLGTRHFSFTETLSTDEEMIGTFIRQYYEKSRFIPKEVLVSLPLDDASLLEDWLEAKKGEKVTILRPCRGEKAKLIHMAVQNAENGLKDLTVSVANDMNMIERLGKRLKMNKIPKRIECFDNSNISGTEPVSGMVVFENGKPEKSSYRKYKIKTVAVHNDYAYMDEALKRRYEKKGKELYPDLLPDLLMVDGGKGQLNIAVSVIEELGLEGKFEIVGIAKKDEKKKETQDKIYKPGRANPVNFGREVDLLFFLERIRDEAHRFAISFHRRRRAKTSIHSALDSIPGIGKKRKAMLLKSFGSIKKIRAATLQEISALPGINLEIAKNLKSGLKN